jgi:hypothetical protein
MVSVSRWAQVFLTQSFERPVGYLLSRTLETTPSRPVLQACLNISWPSISKLSLNWMAVPETNFLSSALAAELVVTSTGNELRALITDNNLAGDMSGMELAGFAKRRFPNLNVIIISGKPVKPVPYHTTFLPKPFLLATLLDAIRA